ncbi:CocE/NonD family hydrolase C-terminal non-catalytic domain-containing protein, partial [Lacticaseibacillus paracasei]|uniref:CocE/NonD family hydrolase C-terminal non-catalytic domain-containing protein n=1 Tax=Lacticaseibacillus paracasei TaxID=1597 RepID=UPI001CDCECE8
MVIEFINDFRIANIDVLRHHRHSLAKPDDYQQNQTVTLTLPLQPVYHHLEDGHQLELILFATDY